MPLFIILPFIFTTIVYWMSGLYADFGVYVVNVIIAILTANVAISIGLFCGVRCCTQRWRYMFQYPKLQAT